MVGRASDSAAGAPVVPLATFFRRLPGHCSPRADQAPVRDHNRLDTRPPPRHRALINGGEEDVVAACDTWTRGATWTQWKWRVRTAVSVPELGVAGTRTEICDGELDLWATRRGVACQRGVAETRAAHRVRIMLLGASWRISAHLGALYASVPTFDAGP